MIGMFSLVGSSLLFVIPLARSSYDSGAAAGAAMGMMCCMLVVPLLFALPTIVGMWKVFEKCGESGFLALVPIYNAMVLARIVGREEVWGLLCLIPIAGIYFFFVLLMDLVQKFGRDVGFAVGMILLPFIFWPILGFSSDTPRGSRRRPRRPSRVEEDDDDDYDDRPRKPRRRRRYEDEDDDY